jgi:hypothetical protein
MGICYVLSDSFRDDLVKNIDHGQSRRIIDSLETRKRNATTAEAILERKTYRGTKHVRQVKIGQWRIASLYVSGMDVAEVVQLCYLYNKNQNGEPDEDVLEAIDETATQLFAEVADWTTDEQSDYLTAMQTNFPDV